MKPKMNAIEKLKEDIAAAQQRISVEQAKIAASKERIKREQQRIRKCNETILSHEAALLAAQYRASNMSLADALAALELSADAVQAEGQATVREEREV